MSNHLLTWVDFAMLGLLLLSGLIGFMSGLVRSVLTIGAWVGAVVIAIKFYPRLHTYLSHYMPSPEMTDPVGGTLLFLVSMIVLSLITKTIGHAVRSSALGGIDRTLGFLFGVARGIALAIAFYIIAFGLFHGVNEWPPPVLDAFSRPLICRGALWVSQQIRDTYDTEIQNCLPPSGRQAALDGILKASPTGRAFDPPIRR